MQSIAKTIFQKIGYGVSGTLYNASYESGSKDPNYPDPNLPHDREQCLNLFVNMVDIALEPIIWEEGHNISNAIRPIRAQLKANTCLFFHASIFTYYSLNPDIGVLIEFGTYDKHRAGEYHSRVYYLNEEENGLRFAGVTKEQYIAYRSKSKGTEFFECHVKNPMTVGQLLGKVQSRYSWTSDDYNLLSQNCQKFCRPSY
ncbi:uncharacterized protein GO595_010742 [Histomonas meleagridis]|uniref:uncharacterized protein n=1 Tax=Histomonas meleagridis TaxID=135588 RepID=UPI00355AB389|nr:hypothetical protein GO595_010742 [Histomonas meleagridis]